jgi:GMP synthase-like glutamine amidotransferase
MRIGILETGEVSEEFRAEHGSYPDMFAALFAEAAPDLSFDVVHLTKDEFPASVRAADGWLITGSRHGVYDALPWIAPLEAFLRGCVASSVPVAGICFGHQILARALGGQAEKWQGGWSIGVHDYRILARSGWMTEIPDRFALQAMHQDQVTRLPEGAHVLASAQGCPVAAMSYGPLDAPLAISIQPHPEFRSDYARALIEARSGSVYPETLAAEAQASIDRPVDSRAWARAIAAFFRQAASRKSARTAAQ